VLKSIGVAESSRRASIRFGLHRFSTKGDIDFAIREIAKAAQKR
jgi:cysteine sulfinate desulfinase/cysteine desulfurase-like protein